MIINYRQADQSRHMPAGMPTIKQKKEEIYANNI
jgi:hypothetical protein